MSKVWRTILLAVVLAAALLAPAAANATIGSVFGGTVTCTTQTATATAGQRWCGNSSGTTVASFDGTPIDVSVAFPAESGSDNNYPIVGIYHGWGGSKITPSSSTAQRWPSRTSNAARRQRSAPSSTPASARRFRMRSIPGHC